MWQELPLVEWEASGAGTWRGPVFQRRTQNRRRADPCCDASLLKGTDVRKSTKRPNFAAGLRSSYIRARLPTGGPEILDIVWDMAGIAACGLSGWMCLRRAYGDLSLAAASFRLSGGRVPEVGDRRRSDAPGLAKYPHRPSFRRRAETGRWPMWAARRRAYFRIA